MLRLHWASLFTKIQMMKDTTSKLPGAWVADLAWPEVEARIQSGAIAILPVGAAAKEHGRHLPLNTDQLQAEWLATRLIEKANVLVWPTLTYGHYPAFTDYPGSCSLSAQTFAKLVEETLVCILNAGAKQVLILNTGISTIKPIERTVMKQKRAKLANAYQGPRYLKAEKKIKQQPHGSHADELETSVMLAIAPEKVDMSKAAPWAKREMQPGKLVKNDPSHPNYSPDGVYGDPMLATREKGERLLAAMLEDVLDAIAKCD
ncbi:MAG TPA: creatininase family protein [Burkholderiales bacterium]|nr:creatininase family protein [Burkholderiales bacterium]